MNLGPIPDPFAGERIADVHPRLAGFIEQSPRLGRLHFFPGRHLTDVALQREQEVRVQRLMLRGKAAQPGVVHGLEVGWRRRLGGIEFTVGPGQALTSSGVDLVIDRTVEVPYEDLRLFDSAADSVSELPLGLLDDAPAGPFAAVLLLQPGFAEDADLPLALRPEPGASDFTPCARVPEDEVFVRTTVTDAARLLLFPLPWAEAPGLQWQNRLAWSIFDREAAGEELPWNRLGVPLALIGFGDGLVPEWIDRHAVVRPAGRPRRRVLIQPEFDARVWNARFDQFCAELSQDTAPAAGAFRFARVPPVGLLPRSLATLRRQAATREEPAKWQVAQHFFPANYTVDVSVVPLEQLDALIADSLKLQPYDLQQPDAVRLLLPVSQAWFDPELLQIDPIDPRFAAHIHDYREARGRLLARRYDLAQRQRALQLAMDGTQPEGPASPDDPDPKRLETPEEPLADPPGEPTQFGVTRRIVDAAPVYTSDVLAEVHNAAEKFLKRFTEEDIAEFRELFAACGVNPEQVKAAFGGLRPPDWLARMEFEGNDASLDAAEKAELRRELLAYLRRQLEVQEQESKQAGGNLQAIIDYFSARAEEADELVESGFLKVRTDVFRLGNLLSNHSLASKFTASPSLANIIERKPPKADPAGVNAFASQLLAHFAPSALAQAATAENPPAGEAPAAATAATRAGDTVVNRGVERSLPLKRDRQSVVARELLTVVDQATTKIERNQDTLKVVDEKLLGANSPLSREEKEAFSALRESVKELATPAAVDRLRGVVEVAQFADNYVANFNLLSQKQIRAIPLERLQPPLAPTVRQEIHDGRLEIFERLVRLGISLADLTTDFVDAPGRPVRPAAPTVLTRIRFQTLISHRKLDTLTTLTKTSATTTEVNDADESRHFASGVAYADMAMAALRAVEARIREYRAFVDLARNALRRSAEHRRALESARAPVEVDVAEARHDVAVALALAAEEQARLDAIHARRAQVLAEHVEFLVFHRPRAVALNTDVPSRRLEPALRSEPALDVLQEGLPPPPDLLALREPFRASPARWFRHVGRWLDLVDRREHLWQLLEFARTLPTPAVATPPAISPGRFAAALGQVVQTRLGSALQASRQVTPATGLSLAAASWLDLRREAERQLTLGQLIQAGNTAASRSAAEELDRLFTVAGGLYRQVGRVPGLVRLRWADQFGAFDAVAPDFRDLSRLPGWPGLDFTLRRELQRLVDWLFDRVQVQIPEALDLIQDLVRASILLASHAPVDELVVGHPIVAETIPRPGGLLRLAVDPLRVRRGMEAIFPVSPTQVLRAVVEDISPDQVAARIVEVPVLASGSVKLTPASTLYLR